MVRCRAYGALQSIWCAVEHIVLCRAKKRRIFKTGHRPSLFLSNNFALLKILKPFSTIQLKLCFFIHSTMHTSSCAWNCGMGNARHILVGTREFAYDPTASVQQRASINPLAARHNTKTIFMLRYHFKIKLGEKQCIRLQR